MIQKSFIITIFLLSKILADCEYMYGQYYTWGGTFDLEEYVFGNLYNDFWIANKAVGEYMKDTITA